MTEATAIQQGAKEQGLTSNILLRWVGAWVDFIVLGAIILVPALAFDEATFERVLPYAAGVAIAYFPLMEGLLGWTVGKLLTGLRIVDKNGRRPGLIRALGRTLLRLIEVNPFLIGGLPAGITVMVTDRRQRLGDLVAGTYVLSGSTIKSIRDTDAALAEFRAAQGS